MALQLMIFIPYFPSNYLLAPQLTGKAQQAYAAMDAATSGEYDAVKKAILRRYDVSEESYRQRFRTVERKEDETYQELATRLLDLVRKWMADHKSVAEVLEVLAIEQFLATLPENVRVWVRERKPKTCAEAGTLADDFQRARQPTLVRNKSGGSPPSGAKAEKKGTAKSPAALRPELKCYSCGQKGHIAARCPSKALCCRGGRNSGLAVGDERKSNAVYREGRVGGVRVEVLLDTGSDRTYRQICDTIITVSSRDST